MNRIAQMSESGRAEVFGETADRKDLPDAVVEKDFWVCWVLKQLFSIDAFEGRLLFKGGTSLSKIFNAIYRFSEDIDLAVDYAALGFTGKKDPRLDGISKTKQGQILAEMMAACQRYIAGEFIQELRIRFEEVLGKSGGWSLEVSQQDANIVRFIYPRGASKTAHYVSPQVILEMGTHAEFVPRDRFMVRSFIAEEFPHFVEDLEIPVVALLAKRTFWEKATILHAEYHRPNDKALPGRYSRHYYDVAMLALGPIRAEALADLELLAQVVTHKKAFYAAAWARYDIAKPGSLRFLPMPERIPALRHDYREMAVMIFGDPPKFDLILDTLSALEREVNATS